MKREQARALTGDFLTQNLDYHLVLLTKMNASGKHHHAKKRFWNTFPRGLISRKFFNDV